MAVISFYKNAKSRPQKIQKELGVYFKGEAGGSGSLQQEFFEDALKETSARLFDGEDDRCIPKKDWSLEILFEIIGMLLAHSLVRGGPGLPCLIPAVFEFLVSGNTSECYPSKDDIPFDLSTHNLITFIEKVSLSQTVVCVDVLSGPIAITSASICELVPLGHLLIYTS